MIAQLDCRYLKTNRCRVCIPSHLQSKAVQLASTLDIDVHSIHLHHGPTERFRDKMKLQISGSVHSTEHLKLGFLDPEDLVVKEDLTHCPLHHPFLEELIPKIKKLLVCAQVPPFDIQLRKGEAKGVIAFISPTTNQSYLRLVLRSQEAIDRIRNHLHLLPEVDVISVNIQPTPHALLEGDREIYLKGKYIEHRFGSCKLYLSPQGFVQTNTFMAQKLYQKAGDLARKYPISKAMDLFCGHGPFSFVLNSNSIHCTGVEINSSAVEFAKKTTADFYSDSLAQLDFVCARSDEVYPLVKKCSPDLIVVNPPRAGLKEGVDLLLKSQVRYILYSSCSAQTLSSDYQRLKPHYQIREIDVFDMFAHSIHFETLVLLEKASPE